MSLISKRFKPYMMVAPAIIVLLAFYIIPTLYMTYNSFFKWNRIGPRRWVGLKNYENLFFFKYTEFWEILGNTVIYTVSVVFLTMSLAILLALYLNKNTMINRFLRSLSFAPHIISLASVSFIWLWLLDTDFGLLNYILSLFGIDKVGWLSDPDVAIFSLVMVSIWKELGYNALILGSALTTIPKYLYEAAELDSAGKFVTFYKITLPMLSPSIFFLTFMNIIGSFKVYETIAIMTGGGPQNSTNTLVYAIYNYGMIHSRAGYASAVGVVLFLFSSLIAIAYFKFLSKQVHYK